MSAAATPEASSTRQRTNKLSTSDSVDADESTPNPASLSGNPNKKVTRNKPIVKPPFIDMSMNKFLSYLVLSMFAILAFYVWRFTVYARDVGGYWAVITGHHKTSASYAAEAAADAATSVQSAQSLAASSASAKAGTGSVGAGSAVGGNRPQSGKASSSSGEDDVQTQILHLANSLGIKPAELSAAIRPLIDPSVPNPIEKAQTELELLRSQIEAEAKKTEAKHHEEKGAGVLGVLGEALLD